MSDTHHPDTPPPGATRPSTGSLKAALWMAALIALFYVLREHWEHVVGNWPYLLLLACPLMHLFHGHGRGQHSHHPGNTKE